MRKIPATAKFRILVKGAAYRDVPGFEVRHDHDAEGGEVTVHGHDGTRAGLLAYEVGGAPGARAAHVTGVGVKADYRGKGIARMAYRGLHDFLTKNRPDVTHVHGEVIHPNALLARSREFGRPETMTTVGKEPRKLNWGAAMKHLEGGGTAFVSHRIQPIALPQGEPLSKGMPSLRIRITDAAVRTATNPTDGQVRAGNYPKGKCTIHGIPISIENPRGSLRRGISKSGNRWSCRMGAHYGYIRRHGTGADGDPIDVFIGPHPESEIVFIIDQRHPQGDAERFDEHKVVLGARSEKEARQIYLSCYRPGWRGLQAITPMTIDRFREWLDKDEKSAPAARLTKGVGTDLLRILVSSADIELLKAHDGWKQQPRWAKGTENGGRWRPIADVHDENLHSLWQYANVGQLPSPPQRSIAWCNVGDQEARKVKRDTGLDIAGFSHVVTSDELRHIHRRHGVGSAAVKHQGQIPITEAELLLMKHVVANPSHVSVEMKLPGKSQFAPATPADLDNPAYAEIERRIVYHRTFTNGSGQRKTLVVSFSKRRRTLTLKTAYVLP